MLRDNALEGKVIVVTGGGSGLGKAMTKYFLELGAKVAITSRDLEKLRTTAEELEKKPAAHAFHSHAMCVIMNRSKPCWRAF